MIRLWLDFDSTHQSGHHDSMSMRAWIHSRRHFTSEVGKKRKKAIPMSTIEGCYPILIHQRERHSYYRDIYTIALLYALSTAFRRDKKWTCLFFVVVESKSNHNCNSRFSPHKHISRMHLHTCIYTYIHSNQYLQITWRAFRILLILLTIITFSNSQSSGRLLSQTILQFTKSHDIHAANYSMYHTVKLTWQLSDGRRNHYRKDNF